MLLFSILLATPLVTASSFRSSFSWDEAELSPRQLMPRAEHIVEICGVKNYTFPACEVDTDCQRPGTTDCNLPPNTGIPAMDSIFSLGRGLCRPDTKSCKCTLDGAPRETFLQNCRNIWTHYYPELRVVAGCEIDGNGYCDIVCSDTDPKKCPQPPSVDVPCAHLDIVDDPSSDADPNVHNPDDMSCPPPYEQV